VELEALMANPLPVLNLKPWHKVALMAIMGILTMAGGYWYLNRQTEDPDDDFDDEMESQGPGKDYRYNRNKANSVSRQRKDAAIRKKGIHPTAQTDVGEVADTTALEDIDQDEVMKRIQARVRVASANGSVNAASLTKLTKAICYLVCPIGNGGTSKVRGFFIGQKSVVTTCHGIKAHIRSESFELISQNYNGTRFLWSDCSLSWLDDQDLVVIHFPTVIMAHSTIMGYLPKDTDYDRLQQLKCMHLDSVPCAMPPTFTAYNARFLTLYTGTYRRFDKQDYFVPKLTLSVCGPAARAGWCMDPLIYEASGRTFIGGFHVAGDEQGNNLATFLSQETAARLLEDAPELVSQCDITDLISNAYGFGDKFTELAGTYEIEKDGKVKKFPLEGRFDGVPGVPMMAKSKIVWADPTGEPYDPMQEGVAPCIPWCAMRRTASLRNVDSIPEDYDAEFEPVSDILADKWRGPDSRLLDWEEVINGVNPNDPNGLMAEIQRIPIGASAGPLAPFQGIKANNFNYDEATGKWSMKPELQAQVEALEAMLQNGQSFPLITQEFPKDELRPVDSEGAIKDAHMISNLPLAMLILTKRHTGAAVASIISKGINGWTATTLNPHGPEAELFASKAHAEERISQGDYEKFDSCWASWCWDFLKLLFRKLYADAPEKQHLARDALFESYKNRYAMLGPWLVRIAGCQVSGGWLTLIGNDMINAYVLLSALIRSLPDEFKPEWSNFFLILQGDDHVHGDVRDLFGEPADIDIADVEAWVNHLGFKRTNPTKSGPVSWMDVVEMDFLSRTWTGVFNPLNAGEDNPEKAIRRILCWHHTARSTEEASVMSAVIEATHLSEDRYNAFFAPYRQILATRGIYIPNYHAALGARLKHLPSKRAAETGWKDLENHQVSLGQALRAKVRTVPSRGQDPTRNSVSNDTRPFVGTNPPVFPNYNNNNINYVLDHVSTPAWNGAEVVSQSDAGLVGLGDAPPPTIARTTNETISSAPILMERKLPSVDHAPMSSSFDEPTMQRTYPDTATVDNTDVAGTKIFDIHPAGALLTGRRATAALGYNYVSWDTLRIVGDVSAPKGMAGELWLAFDPFPLVGTVYPYTPQGLQWISLGTYLLGSASSFQVEIPWTCDLPCVSLDNTGNPVSVNKWDKATGAFQIWVKNPARNELSPGDPCSATITLTLEFVGVKLHAIYPYSSQGDSEAAAMAAAGDETHSSAAPAPKSKHHESGLGTVLGGAAGLALGGPVGGAIGSVLGNTIGKLFHFNSPQDTRPTQPTYERLPQPGLPWGITGQVVGLEGTNRAPLVYSTAGEPTIESFGATHGLVWMGDFPAGTHADIPATPLFCMINTLDATCVDPTSAFLATVCGTHFMYDEVELILCIDTSAYTRGGIEVLWLSGSLPGASSVINYPSQVPRVRFDAEGPTKFCVKASPDYQGSVFPTPQTTTDSYTQKYNHDGYRFPGTFRVRWSAPPTSAAAGTPPPILTVTMAFKGLKVYGNSGPRYVSQSDMAPKPDEAAAPEKITGGLSTAVTHEDSVSGQLVSFRDLIRLPRHSASAFTLTFPGTNPQWGLGQVGHAMINFNATLAYDVDAAFTVAGGDASAIGAGVHHFPSVLALFHRVRSSLDFELTMASDVTKADMFRRNSWWRVYQRSETTPEGTGHSVTGPFVKATVWEPLRFTLRPINGRAWRFTNGNYPSNKVYADIVVTNPEYAVPMTLVNIDGYVSASDDVSFAVPRYPGPMKIVLAN
jgi:hypothetical protein